jgi:hypothetical protein
MLEKLPAGDWILVEHPALSTPEVGALRHAGYTNVDADRSGVMRAYTDKQVLEVVRRRGIKLVGYKDLPAAK